MISHEIDAHDRAHLLVVELVDGAEEAARESLCAQLSETDAVVDSVVVVVGSLVVEMVVVVAVVGVEVGKAR